MLADPTYGHFDPANVTLLTDEKATRANILNALQDLILKSQDDDLVFLYVSSHGSPHRAESGLGGAGYIVTYDTAVRNIWVDSLDYEQFYRQVSLLKARRKAVFLDTCYSGQFRKGEKSLSIEGGVDLNDAKRFLSGEGTYVVTSGRADERSWESEELQNSYFTHFLIAALRRGTEPPTLKEVFAGLGRDVADAVSRDKGMPVASSARACRRTGNRSPHRRDAPDICPRFHKRRNAMKRLIPCTALLIFTWLSPRTPRRASVCSPRPWPPWCGSTHPRSISWVPRFR